MNRRRLAIFLPDLRGGGAERTVLGVAGAFAEWHDVDLVIATRGGELRAHVPPGVQVIELGASRVLGSLPRLVAYLRRTRPDAILAALNHANLVAIVARSWSRVPARLVIGEHNHLSTATMHAVRRRDRVIPALVRVLYPRADAVIAVSEGVAEDLASQIGLPRSKLHVVANPVDVDDLQRQAHLAPLHPWLNPQRHSRVALAVGRLTEAKDFGTLLEALAIARAEVDLRLIVLGEGEARNQLESTARRLGVGDVVDLHGFVSNPYPYFRAADLFVLSSRWEGLPTVLIEAVALSGRIVATDCPSGAREILEDAGVGTLVPVGNAAALAAAMVAALDQPAAAHPDVLGRYDPATVRQAYAELLGLPLTSS